MDIHDGNNAVGRIFGDEECTCLGGGAVKRMDDQALVGGMLERGRRFVSLACCREIGLRVRKRMQLRGAAGKGKRENKEQPGEHPLGHAGIIHAPPRKGT